MALKTNQDDCKWPSIDRQSRSNAINFPQSTALLIGCNNYTYATTRIQWSEFRFSLTHFEMNKLLHCLSSRLKIVNLFIKSLHFSAVCVCNANRVHCESLDRKKFICNCNVYSFKSRRLHEPLDYKHLRWQKYCTSNCRQYIKWLRCSPMELIKNIITHHTEQCSMGNSCHIS